MLKLTEAEWSALEMAERATLISRIPDRTEVDALGAVTPGMRVFRKMAKAELLVITEEDPIALDDGELLELTPSVELTAQGAAVLSEIREFAARCCQ